MIEPFFCGSSPYAALGALIGAAYFAALEWNVRLYAGRGAGGSALLIHLARLVASPRFSRYAHGKAPRRCSRASRVSSRYGRFRSIATGSQSRGIHEPFAARDRNSVSHRHRSDECTVVTTWGLIAALTAGSWMVTRRFSVDAGGRQAMIETIVIGIEDQIATLLNVTRPRSCRCSGHCSSFWWWRTCPD